MVYKTFKRHYKTLQDDYTEKRGDGLADIKLMQGDCLELMRDIPDKSIDMILCDLPYGSTQNKWDIVIPFEELWGVQSPRKR